MENEKKELKYKVGQKVRVTVNKPANTPVKIGDKGVVTALFNNANSPHYRVDFKDDYWFLNDKQLAPIGKPTKNYKAHTNTHDQLLAENAELKDLNKEMKEALDAARDVIEAYQAVYIKSKVVADPTYQKVLSTLQKANKE